MKLKRASKTVKGSGTKRKPDLSISNTGERLVPAYSYETLVYGEHLMRYDAALPIVKNKNVLDIASGTGYGSALLGETAASVTGVDVDADAIEYANKNYASKNVKFVQGEGTKIPIADDTFDVVVSYETIEHIKDYKTFMAEVKRVLKKDGLFILSTPNDLEYPEGNHFHIHEFTPKELEKLVKGYFKNIKTYYQGNWLYNGIFSKKTLETKWDKSVRTLQLANISTDQSIYMFLLCANRSITEEVEESGALSEHWSERKKVEEEMKIEKQRQEHIATIRRLEKTVDMKHEETLKALGEVAELHKMQKSITYRILRKTGIL